jgi:hypothetical protein
VIYEIPEPFDLGIRLPGAPPTTPEQRRHRAQLAAVIRQYEATHERYGNLTNAAAFTAYCYWRHVVDRPRFVYFVHAHEVDAVKVGQARDPFKRLVELQCGNPLELHIHSIMLATPITERGLHHKWREKRTGGEWFDPKEPILKAGADWSIRQLQASWNGAELDEIHALTKQMVVR